MDDDDGDGGWATTATTTTASLLVDVLVATPGRLVDVLKRYSGDGDGEGTVDPTLLALERRIMDAFDEKSSGREGGNGNGGRGGRGGGRGGRGGRGRGRRGPSPASSLTLNEIQEMDLDRVDDDGRATLDEMLRGLEFLVMDEADRLLGGAFRDEMDALLSLFPNNDNNVKVKANASGKQAAGADEGGAGRLKTLLFLATYPEQIEGRVDRVLSRMSAGVPLRVSASAAMLQRVVPTSSSDDFDGDGNDGGALSADDEDGGDDSRLSNRQKKHLANTTPISNVLPDMAPKIQHRVIRLEKGDRTQALRSLLDENDEEEWDRVLVFVATRYATEHVSRKLRRYGISAAELHGKLDQDARERRLDSFRAGRTRVLVSTDLAARGIDVEGLPVVVNYDLPRSPADFTHRTGRTGRAGRTGSAITFVDAGSESHFDFIEERELLSSRRGPIEREVLPGFAPDEAAWAIESTASDMSVPGASHSGRGLAHDRTFGGVKGRQKSKKDKLREAAAAKAA